MYLPASSYVPRPNVSLAYRAMSSRAVFGFCLAIALRPYSVLNLSASGVSLLNVPAVMPGLPAAIIWSRNPPPAGGVSTVAPPPLPAAIPVGVTGTSLTGGVAPAAIPAVGVNAPRLLNSSVTLSCVSRLNCPGVVPFGRAPIPALAMSPASETLRAANRFSIAGSDIF